MTSKDVVNTVDAPTASDTVKKTKPLLLKAWKVDCIYAKATGPMVS
jgi:hypothetical protein